MTAGWTSCRHPPGAFHLAYYGGNPHQLTKEVTQREEALRGWRLRRGDYRSLPVLILLLPTITPGL
jgi:hypothetical protein